MLNLDVGVDSDVFLQFKHAIYLLASQAGHLVPIVTGPPENPGPPMITDRLEGRLRKEKETYVLTYTSPAEASSQVDFVVDPDNVAGLWLARKIQLASRLVVSPTP